MQFGKKFSLRVDFFRIVRNERKILTVFLVEQYLELVVQLMLEHVIDAIDRLLVGELAEHERAAAGLLHHLGAVVAGDLAERLVAVHDREVDDLRVRQQETAIR